MVTILPALFDHQEESFYKEIQLKRFACMPVETSCPSAENVNETLVQLLEQRCQYAVE